MWHWVGWKWNAALEANVVRAEGLWPLQRLLLTPWAVPPSQGERRGTDSVVQSKQSRRVSRVEEEEMDEKEEEWKHKNRAGRSGRVGRRKVDHPPLQKLFLSSSSPPSPRPRVSLHPCDSLHGPLAMWSSPPPTHPLAVSAATPQPWPCHSCDSWLTPAAGRVSPAELESHSRCCRTELSLWRKPVWQLSRWPLTPGPPTGNQMQHAPTHTRAFCCQRSSVQSNKYTPGRVGCRCLDAFD